MSKPYEFNWRPNVPNRLLKGELFDRWEEETGLLEENVLFRIDEYGFFLYWQPDGKDGQVLELTHVCDVRTGRQPNDQNLLNKLSDKALTNGWGNIDQRTIIISSGPDLVNITNLVITGSSDKGTREWIESLQKICFNHKSKNLCPMSSLIKHWMKIRLQLNSEKKIPVRSITRTFASGKNERIIFQCLKELGFQSGKNDAINVDDFTFEKFIELYHKICPRTDIEDLFRDLSKGQTYLTVPQLIEFANDFQRDPRLNEIIFPYYDRNSILRLINLYESNTEHREKEQLSITGFYNFLMSDDNAPVFLDRLDVYQDMDQPLCHYFINSSHNTYLTGRQFGGKSSVEMYRRVLLAGCRCIELDCWDGQEDQEPIITHGMALCTDILFKDVIEAIAETAFVTSDFPVILSFENHCSKKQQERLARHCERLLGPLLLSKPIEGYPIEPGYTLPSPNMFKRKILIKNKRLKPDVEKRQLELLNAGKLIDINEVNEDQNAVEGEEIDDNSKALRPMVEEAHPELNADSEETKKAPFNLIMKKGTANGQLSEEEERALLNQYQYTGATTNIHPLLSSIVNYAQPVKFQGFEHSKKKDLHYHMSSFNENVALGHLRSDAIEFVNYNTRQMSRIYPRGGRVDSSNYMPQIFWNTGCQMVSLNFQTPDLGMQLNMGKFEYNGNSGFLLKPDFLRRSDKYFDPFSESPVDGVIAAYCSIRVISGQFLSEKRIGTYVEVDMYGLPTDTIRREFRTKTVPNNGLNPYYNEDPFVFRKIILPDLACIRIGVFEETGKLIGQRVLPLDGLQAGYRHISLRTEGNFPLSLPTLFCHIVLKTYVPDGLGDFVDALNNPKEFLTKEEKRLKQLREKLGIDEKDISVVPIEKKSSKLGNSNSSSTQLGAEGGKKITNGNDKEDAAIEKITRESLKNTKGFQKLLKKQAKEKENLKKKHNKDRALMQKQHSAVIDKMTANYEKSNSIGSNNINNLNSNGKCTTDTKNKNDTENTFKTKMKDMVQEQSRLWANLIERQQNEEKQLNNEHVEQQCVQLVQLLQECQKQRKKDIEAKQKKGTEQLKANQARQSVEDSKRLLSDKNFRNKQDRDRRLRELNSNNMKRFIDERKRLASKHKQENEVLANITKEEEENLNEENRKAKELATCINEELTYSLNPSAVC
ncbi:unnamed protein product [Brachionus calyciflorus]|uniref:1-phosphatidylinositol 4,5-bisphosphate phosphodiesterase n=1 Tax=Brachionus calyciflorus TaxID=104777 RepID=A0A813M755_9BILA|nr:unnamed protein product [Brachionus calyciflorus]